MNIIIEGLDRSGKSTLIKRINEEFPYIIPVHFTTKTNPLEQSPHDVLVTEGHSIYNQIKTYINKVVCSHVQPDINYMFDRFVYTDAALGSIYKNSGKTPTTARQQHEIERIMNRIGTIVIWCKLSDTEFHKKLLIEEGGNEVLLENYDKAIENYDTVMNRIKDLKVIKYDWKDGNISIDDVIFELKNFEQDLFKRTQLYYDHI